MIIPTEGEIESMITSAIFDESPIAVAELAKLISALVNEVIYSKRRIKLLESEQDKMSDSVSDVFDELIALS